jgi:hypothetical protein
MSKRTVNDLLTRHLLPELAKIMGWAETTHPDRMTLQEARQVIAWAKSQPKIMEALRDERSPAHGTLSTFKDLVEHYNFKHPRDANGDPEPWPLRPPSKHKPTPDNPYAGMTRDEAEALLTAETALFPDITVALLDAGHEAHGRAVTNIAALRGIIAGGDAEMVTNPTTQMPQAAAGAVRALRADKSFMEAYTRKEHPDHAVAVAQMQAAYHADYPSEPSATAANSAGARTAVPATGPVTALATPQERIKELRASPAYLSNAHPDHKATVAAMAEAYSAAFPAPAGKSAGTRAAGPVTALASPQERIKELRASPAYLSNTHPDHKATVAAVAEAYSAAFPAPAPQSDGA